MDPSRSRDAVLDTEPFAALNTVEPPILELVTAKILEGDKLRPSGLLDQFPKLAAYVGRGEARPAYERAFAAQWAINARSRQAG